MDCIGCYKIPRYQLMEPQTIVGKNPTADIYGALQQAFDTFNLSLFSGELPPVVISLCHRGDTTRGFYLPERYSARHEERVADEIVLSPVYFSAPLEDTLGCLVHQMAHHWQQHFDATSRVTYHNRRWSMKMVEIGLQPSHDGLPGGRHTGQSMSQYAIADGLFEKTCDSLIEGGLDLLWTRALQNQEAKKASEKSKGLRVKWSCPTCLTSATAEETASLGCTRCNTELVRQ